MNSSYYSKFLDVFWSERFWLPGNISWADIAPDSRTDIQHPDYRHLLYPLPMAIFLLLVRYFVEIYWLIPAGISIGIKNIKPKSPLDNPLLEKAYAKSRKWPHKQIQGLAKQSDMTEREVERWLRLKLIQYKPSALTKFCESSWKCMCYAFSFCYGLAMLWNKSWLWDINECWKGFPHQHVTNDVWWYYMISLTLYWSLCISQFFDVKRKDFWETFIHHVATICLICFSWIVTFFRMGTLILVIHDVSDIFLESAKTAKYAGYQKLCEILFGILTIVWMITRMGLFPFWILRNTTMDALKIIPIFPAYYLLNGLLTILFILHCFWTYLILKILCNAIKSGQVERDVRSSSEGDYSDSIQLEINHTC